MNTIYKEQPTVEGGLRSTEQSSHQLSSNPVAQWMGDHPKMVIGAGVVIGALVGWLVKRMK